MRVLRKETLGESVSVLSAGISAQAVPRVPPPRLLQVRPTCVFFKVTTKGGLMFIKK